MKKSLSLLVAIAMVFSMFASVVSAADKTAGETLKDLGIITGTSEGLQENAEWLRKDVTILLSRLYGAEAEAKATANTHGFADLDAKGYNGYVSWAKTKGLFLGATETTFAPNDSITNYQFATVILRVLDQEQEKYEDNLAKAIELEILPEGTVGTEKALRGAIYTSIVAALDVKVDGKKLGTILKLKGYEVVDLAVESASAAVAKTVVVNFNDEVDTIANADVTVVDVDGNSVPVEKVAVDGKVATVTLSAALAQKAHTVKIAKATSKAGSELVNASAEFTYTKGVPATVSFNSTTVAKSTYNKVAYTVKDANGVDITADFGVTSFQVESSNYAVINGSLTPVGTGFSVVNLKFVDNNEVTTGNVTINVVDALAIKVSKAELTGNSSGVLFLGANNAATVATANVEVKDENNVVVPATVTYASSNPTVVAVVNGGVNNGQITALQVGSATITVTAEFGGQKATSTINVTVKAERKATSYTLDKTSVTVVNNTYKLPQEITVTVFDQYGEVFKTATNVTVKHANTTNGANIIDIYGTGTAGLTADRTIATTDGKAVINVNAAGTTNGSTLLTISIDGLGSKSASASSVAQASTLSGYEVAVDGAKIDSYQNSDSGKKVTNTINVKLYVKDANGNRVQEIAGSNITVELAGNTLLVNNAGAITVAGGNQGKTAQETFKVLYNGVLLGTYNVDVVATHESIVAKVVQNKTSINVTSGTTLDLVGDGKAFTAFNAYGDVVTGSVESAISAKDDVVTVTGTTLTAGVAGTTVVTLKINGQFYQLTVVVQ